MKKGYDITTARSYPYSLDEGHRMCDLPFFIFFHKNFLIEGLLQR